MKSISSVMAVVIILLAVGIFITSCGKEETVELPKLIPRNILFGNPVRTSPKISPDGTMISYLAPTENAMNVWIGTIGQSNFHPVTNDTLRGILDHYWVGDNRNIIYLQDQAGNELYHLFITEIETGETRDLTPFENTTVQIIQQDINFPDEIIISMNKDNPQLFDVFRLNLITGAYKMVATNPGGIFSWIADANLKVRAAHSINQNGGYALIVRESENTAWKTLVEWGPEDALLSGGIGFDKEGRSLYIVDSRGVNSGRLIKMDIFSGKMDVIAEDPQYDISGIMSNPNTYEIQAALVEKDRQEIIILDDSIREDIDMLQKLHPGDLSISARDRADDTWLISFSSDSLPIAYYTFNRQTKDAIFLFDHRPELNDYSFASMEPISFQSRDGLTIHGYITYPPGMGKKNLPMILNVHGGPWIRNAWGFNPEVQWMANRGYVCLQVNYRGSSGYGKKFLNAGNREWGGKVLNDLEDAVDWAVKKEIADPQKVAIYGYSFGGYAALAGAAFKPDLFCCAVAVSGPSNLVSYISSIPPQYKTTLAIIYKRMGNPALNESSLKAQSPLFKADQIKIPMLIAHGANDPRVDQSESDQMVEALKENNIECEYLVFEDEGHGLILPKNRLEFFTRVEQFLAKHLGGRVEPIPSE